MLKRKEVKILLVILIYSLFSGIMGLLATKVYQSTQNVLVYHGLLLLIQVGLSIISIYELKKYGHLKKSFQKIHFKQLIWILPHFILLIITLIMLLPGLSQLNNQAIQVIIIYGITTILIGVSEEILFRGAVLQVFEKHGLPKAMFISAAVFSLFHLSNLISGGDISSVVLQLIFTFIFGLFTAPLVIKQKSLLPIILYHGLWDWISNLYSVTGLPNTISMYSQVLNVLMAILLWVIVLRSKK